jgi:predicted phosphoribosyltransferase
LLRAGQRLAGALKPYAGRRDAADATICFLAPEPFVAVGTWYEDFAQVTDQEVRDFLRRAQEEIPAARSL